MKKLTCNNGDIFGYWTVIDNMPKIKYGKTYVTVQCKCGKIEEKCLSELVRGRTTGCKSCKSRERSRNIHVGDKYKKWTVIDGPKINKRHNVLWLCQCECGEKRWFQGNELTNESKCFACKKCASKLLTENVTFKNGRIGDLTITKYDKIKKMSEKRNISFNVSIEYLWNLFQEQNNFCAITGDYIEHISKASLDRIDSSNGYVEGNVQWVTPQANLCKHKLSMEELYDFCTKVLNHANQQPSLPLKKQEGSETNG